MIFFVRASIRYNYQIHPYIVQNMLINPYCDVKNQKIFRPIVSDNDIHSDLEIPEPPTTCCMSGCANCVWIEYAERLTKIFHDGGEKAQKEIMNKVTDTNMQAFLSMEIRNFMKQKQESSKI